MDKKIMISQPMSGKTEKEIMKVRNKAMKYAKDNGYDVVDNMFNGDFLQAFKDFDKTQLVEMIKNKAVWFLGLSINRMGFADIVYMCKGWENARGCKIEHEVAKQYGLEIIYEE